MEWLLSSLLLHAKVDGIYIYICVYLCIFLCVLVMNNNCLVLAGLITVYFYFEVEFCNCVNFLLVLCGVDSFVCLFVDCLCVCMLVCVSVCLCLCVCMECIIYPVCPYLSVAHLFSRIKSTCTVDRELY